MTSYLVPARFEVETWAVVEADSVEDAEAKFDAGQWEDTGIDRPSDIPNWKRTGAVEVNE